MLPLLKPLGANRLLPLPIGLRRDKWRFLLLFAATHDLCRHRKRLSLLISPTHDSMLGNCGIKAAFFIYLREVASAYLLIIYNYQSRGPGWYSNRLIGAGFIVSCPTVGPYVLHYRLLRTCGLLARHLLFQVYSQPYAAGLYLRRIRR